MNLILGLGNPGEQYEKTRHNVGFRALDVLMEKHNIKLNMHKYLCAYGKGQINDLEVVAAKPMTFMNESGMAAKSILSALDILPESIIVVHDDIDLPLGKIKKKHKGSDAGQLGVRSIIDWFQTDRFTRIRIGVDRPENREDIVDFVLSPFEEDDFSMLKETLMKAVEMIEATLVKFNKQLNKTEEDIEC